MQCNIWFAKRLKAKYINVDNNSNWRWDWKRDAKDTSLYGVQIKEVERIEREKKEKLIERERELKKKKTSKRGTSFWPPSYLYDMARKSINDVKLLQEDLAANQSYCDVTFAKQNL